MKFITTIAALALSATAASAMTVDFSSYNHGDFVDGAFDFGGGLTGTISTTGGSGSAQVFNTAGSDSETAQDPDLRFPNAKLGNVLIINENKRRVDDNAGGGTITFMFDQLVNFESVTLVDIEEPQAVVITTDTGMTPGLYNGDNQFSTYTSTSNPTNFIEFFFGGSGAIDNLEVSLVSEVPLPLSGLLLLGGLGALGLQRRKKV
jgi:hypothetical protein